MAPKKPIKNSSKSTSKTHFSSPKKENKISLWKKINYFINDERTHFILGLLLLLIMLYFLLAFVSYFFTGYADQSKIDLSWSELHQMRNSIQNWTSVLGAIAAETFINRWFGVSSFFILFFGIAVALRLMKAVKLSLWKTFFHCAFWLIWLSVTLGFVFSPFYNDALFFSLGGQHGDYASQWLTSYIGVPGTLMVIIGTLLIYCIISFNSALPFLKRIFSKKQKKQLSPDQNINVAIGTEIVPEEWLSKGVDESNEYFSGQEISDVPFEIYPIETSDENKPLLEEENRVREEENADPNYNFEKLGKYDPTLELAHYCFPTHDLLKVYGTDNNAPIDMDEQIANKEKIISTLQNFDIEIESIKATVGPTITLYEIVPKAGVRISKIRNLESDIMLSLAAIGIRIIAPIPGKGTIGIEVPNNDPQIVSMHSVIASKKFQESKYELPIAFGRTITNEIFMFDLVKMPHLLVAGATGQGKSVGLNAIITSLLYKKHPAELKLVLIDPKKVEFNIYSGIAKHFLAKLPDDSDAIVTDTSKVVETLQSLCTEMDNRYDLLKKAHVRNIKEYNEKFIMRNLNPEKGHKFLPYIVVIIDEFGDLIMTAGKEVEMPIARIAQLARAVGIHMVIATQRPSVNIITGVIKANFPARVAFRVSSMMDSRTILDMPGANQLVGRGDMLFSQGNDLIRIQCAFVDTPEVENIVNYISKQQSYPTAYYLPEYIKIEGDVSMGSIDMSKRDPLFEEAARLIVANQQGSTSLIQRKFSIGYNRAGRIIDQLEVAGIIGPYEGSKARQVLVADEYQLEQVLKHL